MMNLNQLRQGLLDASWRTYVAEQRLWEHRASRDRAAVALARRLADDAAAEERMLRVQFAAVIEREMWLDGAA